MDTKGFRLGFGSHGGADLVVNFPRRDHVVEEARTSKEKTSANETATFCTRELRCTFGMFERGVPLDMQAVANWIATQWISWMIASRNQEATAYTVWAGSGDCVGYTFAAREKETFVMTHHARFWGHALAVRLNKKKSAMRKPTQLSEAMRAQCMGKVHHIVLAVWITSKIQALERFALQAWRPQRNCHSQAAGDSQLSKPKRSRTRKRQVQGRRRQHRWQRLGQKSCHGGTIEDFFDLVPRESTNETTRIRRRIADTICLCQINRNPLDATAIGQGKIAM